MGLSTKQGSSDHGLDWNQTFLESAGTVELPKPPQSRRQQQQQQQQSEPLKCPRCGSTNTKFCYYNNYNKSQPRHFCKACKRHWTKGGTLRSVPVGGGRKHKRLKTTTAATTTTTTAPGGSSISRNDVHHMVPNSQQDCLNFPLAAALNDQKNISDILNQALIRSSSSVQYDSTIAFSVKTSMINKNTLTTTSPTLSMHQDQSLQFSFSSLSPSDTIPCSFPSSNLSLNNAYDYIGRDLDHVESSTITTVTPTTSETGFSNSWQAGPTTSSVMAEMQNYWNWNDIDPLVSADLNIQWDDTEIKP